VRAWTSTRCMTSRKRSTGCLACCREKPARSIHRSYSRRQRHALDRIILRDWRSRTRPCDRQMNHKQWMNRRLPGTAILIKLFDEGQRGNIVRCQKAITIFSSTPPPKALSQERRSLTAYPRASPHAIVGAVCILQHRSVRRAGLQAKVVGRGRRRIKPQFARPACVIEQEAGRTFRRDSQALTADLILSPEDGWDIFYIPSLNPYLDRSHNSLDQPQPHSCSTTGHIRAGQSQAGAVFRRQGGAHVLK